MRLSLRIAAPAVVAGTLSTASIQYRVNANGSVGSCCSSLEAISVENILYPEDGDYEARIESYFSVSCQLNPGCIVQPTSAEEVSNIITTLVKRPECQFAIRGGGHTVWPGANNIDDGVTIDLGLMNKTTYVEDTKVAQIEAGSIWRDVYGTLEDYGVTVPGGRTATVGVAGFLTGGGNTFYAGRRGFGCDNVVNFQVVLANGDIINANKDENSDLFKALKGGSANFGIVTRFDMQAFEAPDLWGGLVTYPSTVTDQFVDAYHDWVNNIENYVDGSAIPFWTYDPEQDGFGILAAYDDITGAMAPPAFDKFIAIPGQTSSSLRIDSHRNLAIELAIAYGYRNVWFVITFKNDKSLYKKAIELQKEFVKDWKEQSPDKDFFCHVIFQAIPTIFSKHSVEKGGNVMGLDRETENAVMLQVIMMVKGVELEELARKRMVKFRETIKQYSVDQGGAVDWQYLNYADYTQDPLKTYGEENVALIRQVAAKYDPEGVFQTRMPGGFKISNVK